MAPYIYKSPLSPVDIPSNPLGEFVLDSAASKAQTTVGRPIIIDGDNGENWSYEKFVDCVTRLAGGLVKQGIRHGSVVALIAPNSPEFVVAFHAIVRLGATVTTINPQYSAAEIHKQLLDSNPVIAFCADSCLPTLTQAEASKNLKQIIRLPDADSNSGETDKSAKDNDENEHPPQAAPAPIVTLTASLADA